MHKIDTLLLMVGEINGTVKAISSKVDAIVTMQDHHDERIKGLETKGSFQDGSKKSYVTVSVVAFSVLSLIVSVAAIFN